MIEMTVVIRTASARLGDGILRAGDPCRRSAEACYSLGDFKVAWKAQVGRGECGAAC